MVGLLGVAHAYQDIGSGVLRLCVTTVCEYRNRTLNQKEGVAVSHTLGTQSYRGYEL